jgi:Ca2+-binding RTX toxin-like protein
MRRRAALIATAAVVAVCLAPSAAQGSTASVDTFSRLLEYAAATGEVNNVTFSRTAGGFVISDPGATITAGAGCTSNGAHQVTCDPTSVNTIFSFLRDLNDTATVEPSVSGLSGESFFDAGAALEGMEGNDTLNGGANVTNELDGDSEFFESVTDGNDTLNGGNMSDEFFGAGGNDTMTGGGGDDRFRSESGNDVMNGGPGSDSFDAGGVKDGADTFNGGPDEDRYSSDREASVHISLDGVADDGEDCPGASCEKDNVQADVEDLDTGDGDDVLVGSPSINSISSGDGNDTVDGGVSGDSLFTSRGNDVVHGGPGPDTIGAFEGTDQVFGDAGDDSFFSTDVDDDPDRYSGGKGTDVADYSSANSAVRVKLDNQANDGVAGEGDNVLPDVEDVFGSNFNDVLIGSRRANEFDGGNGNDRIKGMAGADGLIGGRGADNLLGGKGADTFDGGAAPDRIVSRDGRADEVECGSSFDRVKGDSADRFSGDCDKISVSRR